MVRSDDYYNKIRRGSKQLKVGTVLIGGDAPVSVQTMLSVPAGDIAGNIRQAAEVEAAGCDILRVAIPDFDSVCLVEELKKNVSIPVVADIHFDYRLAIEAVKAGADKIRFNPGNIGSDDNVKAVARECFSRGVPIRIGVNAGSLEKEILKKYGSPTPEALCESALYHASLLEKFGFYDIVLSLKSSHVDTMVKAYELAAQRCDYPLHLGVTEAGTYNMGIIKSSVGIGALLLKGIGDTVRISLTDEPIKEVKAGFDLLKVLGVSSLKKRAVMISCPTCGRTQVDLINIAKKVESYLDQVEKDITVAVMGCVVNGPGEARQADIGIAGGKGRFVIFKRGETVKTVSQDDVFEELMKEIDNM